MCSHFCIPVLTCAIRLIPEPNLQPSFLDHTWLNSLDSDYHTRVILSDSTDYSPVFINDFYGSKLELTKIVFKDYSDKYFQKFKRELIAFKCDSQ